MLTLEEAMNLYEKGYIVTHDADKREIVIEQETKMPLESDMN